MSDPLQVINYPDPRLKQVSTPVEDFDAELESLAVRMLELMRESKGVGLAAPQVGINRRFFVMNPTGDPDAARVIVNPELSELEGSESSEEGCLSIPELRVQIERSAHARLKGFDVHGEPIDLSADGYIARIWQHEFDHLNGILLIDRMGMVNRALHRGLLRGLEEQYAKHHPAPPPKKPARTSKKSSRRVR
ncbi:MAG: peptide deformylase [Phycisphaerae bacterium]|nr:peptide deformylase [Phycisphaerae bacterium]